MNRGLQRALDVLKQRCDVDFAYYEPKQLHRRIQRRIEAVAGSDSAYEELLYSDPDEVDSLYHDVLIGSTEFFGDRGAYVDLGRSVRRLFKHSGGEIRAWVAGCGTGEELYSVVMLLDEARATLQWNGTLRVFATDVHQEVLKQAAEATYPEHSLQHVSLQRRRRYFKKEGDHYRVADTLREAVVFVNHNLVTDAPFTQLDLICCRNVLSYFEPETQATVLEQFRFALRPGGLLFLGCGETLGPFEKDFGAVSPSSNLYLKRRERRPWARVGREGRYAPAFRGGAPAGGAPEGGESVGPEVYAALLERYMPAAFVLDENLRLVSCFGGADRLLKCDPRDVDIALPGLLESPLKAVVSELLDRYRQRGGLHSEHVHADIDRTRPKDYRVTISPLGLEASASKPILVEIRPLAA